MLCTNAATTGSVGSRRLSVAVRCSAQPEASTRRALLVGVLAGVATLSAVSAPKAFAMDIREAQRRKEARKNRLKEAAVEIKTTGKDQQVFKKSAYSMPDGSQSTDSRGGP